MTGEPATTTGRCYACKSTFSFDPQKVETMLVDPETNRPPGITALGTLRPALPDAVARSIDEPICPECIEKARRITKTLNLQQQWDGEPPTSN
ncbi:hypothetical protein [Nonomuraea zeae]|uniref:Uncharacterized protein n=1 Tax=Nonomuraea zeae TaxID=1642303 RepID=A0A5S4F1U4_9ACTN|nr:hypothetical protein [Nonomuraea zeae]TMR09936.1 hypothetical protein ETD85_60970 [Nonomuraea zeae]